MLALVSDNHNPTLNFYENNFVKKLYIQVKVYDIYLSVPMLHHLPVLHIITNDTFSFFIKTAEYSLVPMHHTLFIYPSNGHLDCL